MYMKLHLSVVYMLCANARAKVLRPASKPLNVCISLGSGGMFRSEHFVMLRLLPMVYPNDAEGSISINPCLSCAEGSCGAGVRFVPAMQHRKLC